MNKYREQLVDRMITMFGHEDPNVVSFAKACESERLTDEDLEQIVINYEDGHAPNFALHLTALYTIHYVGVISAGMVLGAMVATATFIPSYLVIIGLGTALAIATKIAIKDYID